jgi:hypothetical protein
MARLPGLALNERFAQIPKQGDDRAKIHRYLLEPPMAHNSSCANAATPVCRCAGCAGSLHGWQPYIAASHAGAPALERLSDSAERAWTKATRQGTRPGPTRAKARAAVRGACVGLARWFASDRAAARPAPAPASVDDIAEEIGNLLAKVANQLDGDHAQRLALADHFFCGLLAELANAIQMAADALDTATEEIVSAIMEERSADNRSPVSRVVTKVAVQAVMAGLKDIVSRLALVGHIDRLQRAVRILAILMCPAPDKHRAVVEYCIDPLEQPIITQVIRQRLEATMPGWMTTGPVGQTAAGL